jgi:hypothetical protein
LPTQPELILSNPAPAATPITRAQLEAVYGSYPKKTGKAKGLDKLVALGLDPVEFSKYRDCVVWMANAWAGYDKKYCPGFEPFVTGRMWNDEHWRAPSLDAKSGVGNLGDWMGDS